MGQVAQHWAFLSGKNQIAASCPPTDLPLGGLIIQNEPMGLVDISQDFAKSSQVIEAAKGSGDACDWAHNHLKHYLKFNCLRCCQFSKVSKMVNSN
jgi:hypothetical protein